MAVLEICTFVPSAADDVMRAADARMQTGFAYQQPGLARRTTARDGDGRWCVVTLWASYDDAAAAEAAARSDDVARAFWSLVDDSSISVQRFTLLE
jgi:hypothetical protein